MNSPRPADPAGEMQSDSTMNEPQEELTDETNPATGQQDGESAPAMPEPDAGVSSNDDAHPEEPSADEQIEKWRDIAARAQADLENYRKRMAREKSEAIQYANRSLLESLLPVVDNFEMGLQAARQESENSPIFQGMAMVQRQLQDFLSAQGVEAIDPTGEKFDPNMHEAIKQEPSETVAEGQVVAVVRRGYRLRDRLIRAANVIVSSGPDEGNGE